MKCGEMNLRNMYNSFKREEDYQEKGVSMVGRRKKERA